MSARLPRYVLVCFLPASGSGQLARNPEFVSGRLDVVASLDKLCSAIFRALSRSSCEARSHFSGAQRGRANRSG